MDSAGEMNILSVTAGLEHACGILEDESVICWGRNDTDQAEPPAGGFLDVSMRQDYGCGVGSNSSIQYRGDVTEANMRLPEGRFALIAVG